MGYEGCNINSATDSCCKIKWYLHIVYYTGDKYQYLFSMTQRHGQNNQWKSPHFSEIERSAYTYTD